MISFKEGQKRFVAVAMSALLVATPVLGGCTSSKATQQASQAQQQEIQAEGSHAVALLAALSFIDQVGDNLKATFDVTALSGQFADNISGSDVKVGMDLANAKVDSFKKGDDPSQATLTVEFPANGYTPETIKGYGDIVIDSKALRDANGNEGVTSFPAVVSLASEEMARGEDSFSMPITKNQFDKYSTYVNKVGKTLGLKSDTVNDLKEAENYVSQALGIGEDIASGNYLKAGMNFLRAVGIIKATGGKTDSMKLDEIINMLQEIDAKLDKQTKLLEEISNKIDQAAIGAFKKELGELKNYVGYVNAYLNTASNKLANEGIGIKEEPKTNVKANTSENEPESAYKKDWMQIQGFIDESSSSDNKSEDSKAQSASSSVTANEEKAAQEESPKTVLPASEYAAKLVAKANEIGNTGTISYDAATNGLVEHFSSVVSFLGLSGEQNPIATYYGYMTKVCNFDTQAYIQTALYMQDIEMTLDNVTALIYTTTDQSNTAMLNTFKDQYNNAVQTLEAHCPAQPDWSAPYSYVLGSKVQLQAGVQREADKAWVPDMPGKTGEDFQNRVHDGLANELLSACFSTYNVDGHNYLPADIDSWQHSSENWSLFFVPLPEKLEYGAFIVDYGDKMRDMTTESFNRGYFNGLDEGSHDLTADFIQASTNNPFCIGVSWDNYNNGKDYKYDPNDMVVSATGYKWSGEPFRCPVKFRYPEILTKENGDWYINCQIYYSWSFWFKKI